MNWFVWRVAVHERNRATLDEIETRWTLRQLVDAHFVLDMYDELDRRVAREQERRARAR